MSETILTIQGLADFKQRVLEASHHYPILVDFWADWCGPCLFLAPTLERVVNDYAGHIRLAKVDTDNDENLKLAGRYQVRGFPTVVLIHHEHELARFSSNQTQAFIHQFIATHTALRKPV